MRLLKALSLLAAVLLLSGAVVEAQTGLVRAVLGQSPDAGKKPQLEEAYLNATKAGPLLRERHAPAPPPQALEPAPPAPKRDGGR